MTQNQQKMSYKASVIVLLVLYMTAMIGLITPSQRAWYLAYLPYFMLLNATFLMAYAAEKDKKLVVFTGLTFLGSFLVEYIGTKLGWSSYGHSFGWLVDGVPVTIAVFWLVVIYSSCCMAGKLPANKGVKTATAAALSVILFAVVHQVAFLLDFWHVNASNPAYNFIIPVVISVVFAFLFFTLKLKSQNKMAIYVYGGLFVFFVGMIMFLKG